MQFGTMILREETGSLLSSIQSSCMHQVNCINREILKKWLEGDARFYEPTWSNLVNVLCDIGRKTLAEDVIDKLMSHSVDIGMSSCSGHRFWSASIIMTSCMLAVVHALLIH